MPKVRNIVDLGNVTDIKEYTRHASTLIGDITDAVNGSLEFDHNLNTKTVVVTFTTANVDQMVTHNLGRIPSGFLQSNPDAAAQVFQGSKDSTKTVSYLKASAPVTITLIFH
jgi:hypothetical protein